MAKKKAKIKRSKQAAEHDASTAGTPRAEGGLSSVFAGYYSLLTIAPLIFTLGMHFLRRDESMPTVEIGRRHEEGPAVEECKIYLAMSSIPNAGLGMFTAVDVERNEPVDPSGIVLGIYDFELHNDYDKNARLLTKDYAWNTVRIGGVTETKRVSTIAPGAGMMANSHLGLKNIAIAMPAIDGAGLHRSKDPGAGAISAYHSIPHYATKHIEAGSELFHNYGEKWFKSREDELGSLPFAENYKEADTIVKAFNAFIMDYDLALDDPLVVDLWELIRDEEATEDDAQTFVDKYDAINDSFFDDIVSVLEDNMFADPRTCAALPQSVNEVPNAADIGTARLSVPNFIRSSGWLKENGLCIDNLESGPSTIVGAGRGAFATRFIPKNTVISPAPLIHIPDKSKLDMYIVMRGGAYDQPKKISDQKEGRQLIVNYCYGHRNSTVLLLPYSPGVNFINHRRESPNAMIRWSSSPMHHENWLDHTVEDLGKESHAGLMMEFVASRPIYPGEEVFIDYGKDWDEAWKRYVERWEAPYGSEDYVSASEMNQQGAAVKTFMEEFTNPYPPNIELACWYEYTESDDKSGARDFASSDLSMLADFDEEAAKKAAYTWEESNELYQWLENMHPCRVLAKQTLHDGSKAFIAMITERNDQKLKRFVQGIPRKAIVFLDKQYTSDLHLPNAFRHEIGIPDDMFPSAWKNL